MPLDDPKFRFNVKHVLSLVLAAVLGACAAPHTAPPSEPHVQMPPSPTLPPETPAVQAPPPPEVVPPPAVEAPAAPRIDTMADVPGDKPVPPLAGVLERFDCTSGNDDLHARIAFEARGGRVVHFAYYSKWKPRTCALDFSRKSPGTKWRLTPDGAMRVHTPEGRFLIRTRKDAYVFEFEQVERGRFCGMPGDINGIMTVRRFVRKPECSVNGVLDVNDTFLEALHKERIKK
ncbi:MAG: hypothetical protein FJY56_21500 [Betaproteobacteria bacterium]|nr:hypothetical protein [Betaproteobacteria bacterium]